MSLSAEKTVDISSPQPNLHDRLTEPPIVGEWAKRFYREYVGITDEEELKKHLMEVRGLAWQVYSYYCVASFSFINSSLGESFGREFYDGVLQRLKRGDMLLDLACAFGYTARNLVYDGAPQENIISGDLRKGFWDLGYQLFRDQDKFHGEFREGDIFDPEYLKDLEGKIDIIHTTNFFHLFKLPEQKNLVRRLTELVSTKPGTIIFGHQVGDTEVYYSQSRLNPGTGLYRHTEESFRAMFKDNATGNWDINIWYTPRTWKVTETFRIRGKLTFVITRL